MAAHPVTEGIISRELKDRGDPMDDKKAIMTLSDVMSETGMTRKQATRLLSLKTCPVLPRVKNAPYLVPRVAFYNWLNEDGRKG